MWEGKGQGEGKEEVEGCEKQRGKKKGRRIEREREREIFVASSSGIGPHATQRPPDGLGAALSDSNRPQRQARQHLVFGAQGIAKLPPVLPCAA